MKRLISYLRMIKIEHSLFALPFALSAMFLAADGFPSVWIFVWIFVCMVAARSAAMGINRWADAEIDARNPRTAEREIPAGKISKQTALIFILASFALYFTACAMLNRLTLLLSPLPILIFIIYAYSKRFTVFCHLILGLALGLAPLGAWIAVSGSFDTRILLLGIGVMFWACGFDILYALQDIQIDRKEGLYSIPAFLGVPASMLLARGLHGLALLLFFAHGWYFGLGWLYFTGFALSAALLIYEHRLVIIYGTAKLDTAFFNMNALLSIILFLATSLDIFVK